MSNNLVALLISDIERISKDETTDKNVEEEEEEDDELEEEENETSEGEDEDMLTEEESEEDMEDDNSKYLVWNSVMLIYKSTNNYIHCYSYRQLHLYVLVLEALRILIELMELCIF